MIYYPPHCDFNRVLLNFSAASEGRQFNRLASLWLGDVEIWRTSTAEPKNHPGIEWTHYKDVTPYLSLWKEAQYLTFYLKNRVDNVNTATFKLNLTATFFTYDMPGPGSPPADLIIPVTKQQSPGNLPGAFIFPDEDAASNPTYFPQHIQRASVAILANGQEDDEFWWSHVPQTAVDTFVDTTGHLMGMSASREIRLFIDGRLAGYAYPFPVIFTGGISPPLHRPVVGIQAFDQRDLEIDLGPFLGILCDGNRHVISMDVMAFDNDKGNFTAAPNHWLVSAKVFMWLNPDSHNHTRGTDPVVVRNDFSMTIEATPVLDIIGRNVSLNYTQKFDRAFELTASIGRREGTVDWNWIQKHQAINNGSVDAYGHSLWVDATYVGKDSSGFSGFDYFYYAYNYPLVMELKHHAPDGDYQFTLESSLSQGMDFGTKGLTAFTSGLEPWIFVLEKYMYGGVTVSTRRKSHSIFHQWSNLTASVGFGEINQHYGMTARKIHDDPNVYAGMGPELFFQNITTVNETVVLFNGFDTTLGYPYEYEDNKAWPVKADYAPLSTKEDEPVQQYPVYTNNTAEAPTADTTKPPVPSTTTTTTSSSSTADESITEMPWMGLSATPVITMQTSTTQSLTTESSTALASAIETSTPQQPPTGGFVLELSTAEANSAEASTVEAPPPEVSTTEALTTEVPTPGAFTIQVPTVVKPSLPAPRKRPLALKPPVLQPVKRPPGGGFVLKLSTPMPGVAE